MKETIVRPVLSIVSVSVLTVGLVLTLQSIRRIHETRDVLRTRGEERRALEERAADLDRYVSARTAYEEIPGTKAVRLESLLAEALDGVEADDVRETRIDLVDGWVLRRKEVVLGEIDMSRMMTLIRSAEAQRPPWMLAECVLRASPLAPGRGRAVLTFEVLERSSSASL